MRRCLNDVYFPEQVENVLLFNNDFLTTAKKVRERCITDAKYANAIRWQPAFKQLIYRNDQGKLIVTISQNSIGNAITELLGVVVSRVADAEAYEKREPKLIERLARSAAPSGRSRSGQRYRHRVLASSVAPASRFRCRHSCM